MREVQLTRVKRTQHRERKPGQSTREGDPRPCSAPNRRGETKNIINLSFSRLWGRGRRAAPHIRVPERPPGASGAWKREAPEGPGPGRSRSSAEARGGEGLGETVLRPHQAPPTQLARETTAAGGQGLSQDPRGPLTAGPERMGRPQKETLPEGRFQPSLPLRGRSGPRRGLPTPSDPRPPLCAQERSPLPTDSAGLVRVRPPHEGQVGRGRGARSRDPRAQPRSDPRAAAERGRLQGALPGCTPGRPSGRPPRWAAPPSRSGPLPGGGRVRLSGRRGPLRPRRLPGIVLAAPSIPPPRPPPQARTRPARVARPRPAGPAAMNM